MTFNDLDRNERRPQSARGFTLIEILVVIIIISIVISVVTINFFHDEKQSLNDEARRLALLLEHAREEAMLTGRPIAWSAGEGKYEFLELDKEGKWATKTGDDTLRPREFATPIAWRELRFNGVPVKLGEPLVFLAGGLNSPFDLKLELSGNVVELQGDALGKVNVVVPAT
jgi:general secretion pathway protein H